MSPTPVALPRRRDSIAPEARAPGSAHLHPFRSAVGHHVLVPDGSRIYDIDAALYDEFQSIIDADGDLMPRLRELGLQSNNAIVGGAGPIPPVRYLSLAVAQRCNLGCSYCYADGGDFGGEPRSMEYEVGRKTVDRLLDDCTAGERIGIAFLGGEPLANRNVLHALTRYTAAEATARDVTATFSVTTNATLITERDIDLFDEFAFAVTVSMDGVGEVHDRLRPTRNGGGSYDRIIRAITPMLARQRRLQVSARATVTPDNLDLLSTLTTFLDMGFHSVGFAPALATPTGAGELATADLDRLLSALIECSDEFVRRLDRGERFAFSNLTSALQLIHAGAHRPFPCGAGAAYLGVDADGGFSACHRFVGSEKGRMGDAVSGWDDSTRLDWLTTRHVDRQEPCQSCWARYLCGGGCHHEVLAQGRRSCDFIRSWLEHCVGVYVEVGERHPDWFARSDLIVR